MAFLIPNIFKPKTKARAEEVNENFNVIATQLNSNISSINNNDERIDNLEINKANKNGSTAEYFKCKDAVSDNDAVNKRVMNNNILNTKQYINGLYITPDKSSLTDNTIIVADGSCFDDTGEVQMKLSTGGTSIQNTIQSANTTYYVYIVTTDDGLTFKIEVSPASSYNGTSRKLGYYITNTENKIVQVINYSVPQNGTIGRRLEPDYSKTPVEVSVTSATSFTAPYDGWLTTRTALANVKISNEVAYPIVAYINKDTVISGSSTTASAFNFFPCKEV